MVGLAGSNGLGWAPCMDGVTLTAHPWSLVSGAYVDYKESSLDFIRPGTPAILSSTANDGRDWTGRWCTHNIHDANGFLEFSQNLSLDLSLEKRYEILGIYDDAFPEPSFSSSPLKKSRYWWLAQEAATDVMFRCPGIIAGQVMARSADIFLSSFGYVSSHHRFVDHSDDLPFMFNSNLPKHRYGCLLLLVQSIHLHTHIYTHSLSIYLSIYLSISSSPTHPHPFSFSPLF